VIRRAALLLCCTLGLACEERLPAELLGARLFSDPAVSTSPLNDFACATCHTVAPRALDAPDPGTGRAARATGPILPGYDLVGVVHRPSWWGGYETRLLDAVNVCLQEFMRGAPLAADDPRARQLYEYLLSLSGDEPAPALPMTIVKNIIALDVAGDAGRGRDVFDRACLGCHGQPHTGEGRLNERQSILPEDSVNRFGAEASRAITIEKIRHGKFFNVGGTMPPYSLEAMSDEEVADVLAYLGL
jgi:thiosulfate dehydrogenase